MIAEMIPGGLFSEGAVDRLFQVVNSAVDRLFHGAFLKRHDDWFAVVSSCLDHTAFIVMAGLKTDSVAKVHIDPSDTINVTIQSGMNCSLHLSGRLLAAFDVAACPNFDKHRGLHLCIVWDAVALFDSPSLEKTLVRRVLSYIRGLALFYRIHLSMHDRLAWRNFGVVAQAFLAVVRWWDRRHVSMLGH
jgi:hypothetical protein